jgi:hypothetical protein
MRAGDVPTMDISSSRLSNRQQYGIYEADRKGEGNGKQFKSSLTAALKLLIQLMSRAGLEPATYWLKERCR